VSYTDPMGLEPGNLRQRGYPQPDGRRSSMPPGGSCAWSPAGMPYGEIARVQTRLNDRWPQDNEPPRSLNWDHGISTVGAIASVGALSAPPPLNAILAAVSVVSDVYGTINAARNGDWANAGANALPLVIHGKAGAAITVTNHIRSMAP